MRVLVTGASGFIGQSCVQRLAAAGHSVRAMARRPNAGAGSAAACGSGSVEWVQGDLQDHASLDRACQGMEAVVHLACATGVSDQKTVRAVNVDGTRVLLEAAKRHGVRRFVFISTVSATRKRVGPYGRTKREGEAMVAASGLEWVVLRPSLVYGSAPIGLFATLATYLRKLPVVPVIGNGKIELDPVHVDDVAEVIVQSTTRPDVAGKAYDLLGPDHMTFLGFLDRVSELLGVRKPRVHIPGPVAMLVATGFGMISKRPPITVDNVIGMTSPATLDREPLRRDFPIAWTRVEDGLRVVARAMKGLGGSGNGAGSLPTAGTAEAAGARAGAASHVPGGLIAWNRSPQPRRPVRVGIVGLGKMGVAHTAVLSMIPDCEIVGLCDRQPGLGKSLRGMGHRAPFFGDVGKMLSVAKPDAVFVLTAQNAHLPVARQALEAGAAVFVEKPLAHQVADAEAIASLARQKNLPAACGYTLAYLPVFAAAHQAIASGALGEIRRVRSSMHLSQVFGPKKGWMYEPERSGGGVVANISSHLLFLLEWYFGTPVEVNAKWSKFYGPVEDELHAMMRLPSGLEVGFDSSWSVPGYPLSAVVIEVEGENGKLLVSNDAIELDLREPRGGFGAGSVRVGHGELPQPARFDVNGEGYYLQDAAFLEWVTGGPEPPITAAAALRVQRVMDALYRSAASGAPAAVSPDATAGSEGATSWPGAEVSTTATTATTTTSGATVR